MSKRPTPASIEQHMRASLLVKSASKALEGALKILANEANSLTAPKIDKFLKTLRKVQQLTEFLQYECLQNDVPDPSDRMGEGNTVKLTYLTGVNYVV